MIKQWKIPTITGNNSEVSERPLNGCIKAIYVAYAVTPNAATDVTIATVKSPVKTILTLTNNATSGWFYPRAIAQDDAGATITFDGTNEVYTDIPISDTVQVTVAQGDSDQTVDVWILLEG